MNKISEKIEEEKKRIEQNSSGCEKELKASKQQRIFKKESAIYLSLLRFFILLIED